MDFKALREKLAAKGPPQAPASKPQAPVGPARVKGEVRRPTFAGFKEARPSGDWNNLKAGDYWLKIENVKEEETRQGGYQIKAALTVVHVIDDNAGAGMRVGEEASDLFCMHGKGADLFLPNLKAFMAGALSAPAGEIDQTDIDAMLSDDQPLAGKVVHYHGRDTVSRGGTDIVRKTYKRLIGPAELLGTLDEATLAKHWKPEELEAFAAQAEGGEPG
jgi:hypothetical protein